VRLYPAEERLCLNCHQEVTTTTYCKACQKILKKPVSFRSERKLYSGGWKNLKGRTYNDE
jgi:predicted amidophosphoribosyltransferase